MYVRLYLAALLYDTTTARHAIITLQFRQIG